MASALTLVGKHSSVPRTLLGMSFMIREVDNVKKAFAAFKLDRTNLALEYATVKPNRWDNYGWWQNTDLPMIKRLKMKK